MSTDNNAAGPWPVVSADALERLQNAVRPFESTEMQIRKHLPPGLPHGSRIVGLSLDLERHALVVSYQPRKSRGRRRHIRRAKATRG